MSSPHGSPIHPLEVPFIWFGLQFLELVVVIPALLSWVPASWSAEVRWGLWIAVIVGLTLGNYLLRRRYLPR
jgi:hypothetical protein